MSEKYEVYARKAQDEALTRIGSVDVASGQSVEKAVTKEHGDGWLEIVAIPAGSVTWAIGKE